MKMFCNLPALGAMVFFCLQGLSTIAQTAGSGVNDSLKPNFWAYEILHLPDFSQSEPGKVVKIAVVDDAFRLTHRSLSSFWYKNENEIPGNGIDDDQNGYPDDLYGWDVADNDQNVGIPRGKESALTHGTLTAGTITEVARRCFGENASQFIKIIPVKVVSDNATKHYYELGYEGIAYAIKQNPDIILCAWSGGRYDSEKYNALFLEAQRKGILILASAGNFFSEHCDPPASINSVYAVAAINTSLRKTKASNYGEKVDLVAAGEMVYAPWPESDNTFSYHDGTSSAVSLIAGCAAVLKAMVPKATSAQIIASLKNTASPVDNLNTKYGGKLGAGLPDLTSAVDYLQRENLQYKYFNSRRPEGDIIIGQAPETTWVINPAGGYAGYNFSIRDEWNSPGAQLQFYSGDSLKATWTSGSFVPELFISGSPVRVSYTGKKSRKPFRLSYSSVPVDSTTLYCRGTEYHTSPNGSFDDGSNSSDYSNNASCKWQITVPKGKRIRIEFDEFSTQPKTDYVWLFAGTETLQENALSGFSGHDIPPVIISPTNELLIWFVTDSNITSKGWHVTYSATDEMPGVHDVITSP